MKGSKTYVLGLCFSIVQEEKRYSFFQNWNWIFSLAVHEKIDLKHRSLNLSQLSNAKIFPSSNYTSHFLGMEKNLD